MKLNKGLFILFFIWLSTLESAPVNTSKLFLSLFPNLGITTLFFSIFLRNDVKLVKRNGLVDKYFFKRFLKLNIFNPCLNAKLKKKLKIRTYG